MSYDCFSVIGRGGWMCVSTISTAFRSSAPIDTSSCEDAAGRAGWPLRCAELASPGLKSPAKLPVLSALRKLRLIMGDLFLLRRLGCWTTGLADRRTLHHRGHRGHGG